MKAAKVLNTVSTIRGALTTAALVASAIGGVFTVQTVRSDLHAEPSTTGRPTRPTLTPAATPSAAVLRADAERRLRETFDTDSAAIDELRKIAVVTAVQLDTLITDARAKLQERYQRGLQQIAELAAPSASPGHASPSPSLSIVALNAVVTVAMADMNAIVVATTRAATNPATPQPRVTPTPTRTPLSTPTRTPAPTIRTASPRPSP